MDGLLRFLCLFCVLIKTGHSLSCITCDGSSFCTGPVVTCQSNYSCGLVNKITIESGSGVYSIIRSCLPSNKCNKVGSMSYTGGTIQFGASCCDTDSCTPVPNPVSPANTQPNGLVCSSCRSSSASSCTPDSKNICMGTEQNCIFETTSIAGANNSAMGCATSSLCDFAEYSNSYNTTNNRIQFVCFTAAGTSCSVCSSANSLACTGLSSVIPGNSQCSSAYMITTVGQTNTYQVTRSWVSASKCNITGSMTVAGTKYLMGTSCCDGNECTPAIQNTTSTSTVSNSVQCKTCQSANSSTCETSTTISCTGQENQCVTYALTTTYGTISSTSSMRGCGTKSLCDAQSYSFTKDYMTYVNSFTCETIAVKPIATTTSNGANSITTPSNGGVIYLLLFTAASILILHQFNEGP